MMIEGVQAHDEHGRCIIWNYGSFACVHRPPPMPMLPPPRPMLPPPRPMLPYPPGPPPPPLLVPTPLCLRYM